MDISVCLLYIFTYFFDNFCVFLQDFMFLNINLIVNWKIKYLLYNGLISQSALLFTPGPCLSLIQGSLNKFPDFFRMGTLIDSTHMKL